MDSGLGFFAAPETLRKDKPLRIKPRGPKRAEHPGKPGAAPRFFEEDPGIRQARQPHQEKDKTDEKCMHMENGGVDWAQQHGFLPPLKPAANGLMQRRQHQKHGSSDPQQNGERGGHGFVKTMIWIKGVTGK